MGIHGVSQAGGVAHLYARSGGNPPASSPSGTSIPNEDATTVEISDEARARAAGRKANPQAVAETLGYKNFGQAVRAIKQSEGGQDVSISDLVHGNEEALAAAQEALAPPEAEESGEAVTTDTEAPATEDAPPETEPLVIDGSDLLNEPTELPPPPENETNLLEEVLEELTEDEESTPLDPAV